LDDARIRRDLALDRLDVPELEQVEDAAGMDVGDEPRVSGAARELEGFVGDRETLRDGGGAPGEEMLRAQRRGDDGRIRGRPRQRHRARAERSPPLDL